MNWYLTAPDPARPITIQYSTLGNHDWVMTMPSGIIEWEDPDGLACVNSEVINVNGLGPVQMNFAAVKFGSDNATSDGHVNFGYSVNGGAWTVSPNFSIAGTNTGGSWTQSATGNTIEIRACADFGGQSQDTRLTVFNTNKGAPLPVRGLGIVSSLDKERRVHLSWSTASEVNNDFFEIQRSMDENRYEILIVYFTVSIPMVLELLSFLPRTTAPIIATRKSVDATSKGSWYLEYNTYPST